MIITLDCLTNKNFYAELGSTAMFVAGVTPWTQHMKITSEMADIYGPWTASRFNLTFSKFYGDVPAVEEAAAWSAAEVLCLAIERSASYDADNVRSTLATGTFKIIF